jgi:hypothetical protein
MQFQFGSGLLWGTRNDISPATPVKFGALQDVMVEFSGEVKELFGQYQFPIDVARGKTKITGKAKLANISAQAYNDLFFGQSVVTGQTLIANNEAQTSTAVTTHATSADTPSGSTLPFTSTTGVVVGETVSGTNIHAGSTVVSFVANTSVTLSHAVDGDVPDTTVITFGPSITATHYATYSKDLGLRYAATGQPLKLVTGAPAAGEYALSATAGTYILAAGDASTAMLVDYQYTSSSTGYRISGTNLLMGNTPRFRCDLAETFEDNTLILTLYACVGTKLTLPTKLDDYQISEFDFSAFANAGGQVFDLSVTQNAVQ